MFTLKQFCVFCLMLYIDVRGDDIDADYYFESLRTVYRGSNDTHTSRAELLKVLAKLECPKHHVCFNGVCRCIDKVQDVSVKPLRTEQNQEENVDTDDKEVIDLINDDGRDDEEYSPKPVLRHHIAHFCPNLDVARECIRKCMKVGKPAFCGKDHRCYCGHRYNQHTKDEEGDSKSIYSEFKDLYKKYFGDGYVPDISSETK